MFDFFKKYTNRLRRVRNITLGKYLEEVIANDDSLMEEIRASIDESDVKEGSVKIVNQGSEALVERLGKYHRTLQAGINVITPIVDTIVCQDSIREQLLDIEPIETTTKDNISVMIDALVCWQIMNLHDSYYSTENLDFLLEELTRNAIRREIGSMNLEEVLSCTEIGQVSLDLLNQNIANYGIRINRILFHEINPSKSIKDSLEEAMVKAMEMKTQSEQKGYDSQPFNDLIGRLQDLISFLISLMKENGMSDITVYNSFNVGQAGAVGPNARSDGNTFIYSEQKQTLAEAAEEIQHLIKQLEQTNPNATEAEKVAYVNSETAPSFKHRVVSALQAGGEAAIEEFLDNPYVNVGKAVVKGWIKPE